MLEAFGNLWDWHLDGNWVAITTNGCVKASGDAVMGRGCALEAKRKFPKLAGQFGSLLLTHGNRVLIFREYRIVTFPVKYNWWEPAAPELIATSCRQLEQLLASNPSIERIYLPRPGCGNGALNWETDVKPVIAPLLSDRVVIVDFHA